MTTEGLGAVADASAPADDDRLFCYRHPDRETRIRCGRCDRPICTRCAMQGPVGFRCRNCGTLANDPLRTISPLQGLIGVAVSFGLGALAAIVATRIGFFSIFISFIAGGFIAAAVTQLIGWKRGPAIVVIIFGGIIAGHALGFGLDYLVFATEITGTPAEEQVGPPTMSFFIDRVTWAAVSAGAACFGAYTRLR